MNWIAVSIKSPSGDEKASGVYDPARYLSTDFFARYCAWPTSREAACENTDANNYGGMSHDNHDYDPKIRTGNCGEHCPALLFKENAPAFMHSNAPER